MSTTGLAIVGLGLVLALVLGLVRAAGADPMQALSGMAEGAFGDIYAVAETLVTAVPLALVALGAAPALRAGIFSVGAEGQIAAGAALSTAVLLHGHALPQPVALLFGAGAGIAGGMLYAALPAALRAYREVSEILSTLLLNYIAGFGLVWLLRGPLRASVQTATPHSDALGATALIPKVIETTRLHWGCALVPMAALALGWWLRTAAGLRTDLFATRPALAARLGLTESRAVIATMLVSGAAAGLVGWIEVAGLTGTLYPSVGGGLGFTGVLIAFLGGLRPLGILLTALFFAALETGVQGLQIGTGVPAAIAAVIQGLLLFLAAVAFGTHAARTRLGHG